MRRFNKTHANGLMIVSNSLTVHTFDNRSLICKNAQKYIFVLIIDVLITILVTRRVSQQSILDIIRFSSCCLGCN